MKRTLLNLSLLSVFLLFGTAFGQMTTTFNYTGAIQYYTVPLGVTSIDVDVIGAQGGNVNGTTTGWGAGTANYQGGMGGRVTCTIPVTGGEILEIYVGGQGSTTIGGYNGGGAPPTCTGTEVIWSGGGGASDIRQAGSTLADRIVVGGGGGGASGSGNTSYSSPDFSGAGGGLTGGNSLLGGGSGPCLVAFGGTQVAGGIGGNNACWCSNTDNGGAGTLGLGGVSVCAPSGLCCCSCTSTGCTSGGGGGGGYYGGGAGLSFTGGAGGSSYTDPGATSVVHTQGYQTGDGLILITVQCDPLNMTVSNDTVCSGDSVILDATSTNGGTITWDNGVTGGVGFVPPVGSTVYTATSSDGNDCSSAQTIFVYSSPTVDAGMDQTVCAGDSVTLAGSGADTLLWNGGVLDGIPFVPLTGSNDYILTGTVDSSGCMNTDTVNVNSINVIIGVTTNGTDMTCVQSGATYQWLNCLGMTPLPGETGQSFTPATEGTFACIITMGSCVDTTACIGIAVGLDDLSDEMGIKIYPVPTNNILNVEIEEGTVDVVIFNVKGEEVARYGQLTGKETLDVSGLSNGMYVITFQNEKGLYTSQLIIE